MVELSEVDSKRYKAIIKAKNEIKPFFADVSPDKARANDREIDQFGALKVNQLQQSQKKLTTEEINKIILEYNSGKGTYELAEEFGCHRRTIANNLKKHGIKVDKRTAQKKLDVDTVITMYKELHTSAEIAARYGVHPQTILRCLREHGVQIRGRGTIPREL